MKGKNFSCNNVEQKRKESDFYETPYSMTRQFLNETRISTRSILEPAQGNGAIVNVLNEENGNTIEFYELTAYDKDVDFLKETAHFDWVITNPPFSLAHEFIKKALEVSDRSAFLLPLSYLHGQKRFEDFYSRNYLIDVYVFTRYPMLGDALRNDGKYRTGMMSYAWFIFDSRRPLRFTEIHWLNNQEYVLSKKDL